MTVDINRKGTMLEDIAEKLHPPRRHDLSFYVVLVVAVIPLWSVIPLSWAFVIYALRTGAIWSFAWKGKLVFAVALVEVFFSVYHFHLSRSISGLPPDTTGSLTELQATFKRVLQAGLADLPEHGYDEEDVGRPGSPAEDIITLEFNDHRAVDFRNYLRTWFGKVRWSDIRRQEMFAWLNWAIFNAPFTSLDVLPPARKKLLLEVLEMIEKRAGAKILEGCNGTTRPLLLTLDSINVSWRPFFWYLGVALSNHIHRRHFRSQWNATIATYNGMEYILRIPPSWSPKTGHRPIVFMHGLGLGLTQYKIFLTHLFKALVDRPILIPLQPHVSQEIFHPRYLKPMSKVENANALAGLLIELGWVNARSVEDSEDGLVEDPTSDDISKGVTVMSHSNGSFLHAWMLKAHPHMITRSCFVDPVVFCSWEGDLCYNFIYRPCRTGMELVMKYFVGTELGVANFLQRHFDWNANALWYEQIPNARDCTKTAFFLGGKDAIVDASRVKRYLTSHGIRQGLWYDPNGCHGQALLSGGPGHGEILRWLRDPAYEPVCTLSEVKTA